MTPLPVCHWSSREIDIAASGLRVLPLSPEGLLLFTEFLRTPEKAANHFEDCEDWKPPFPKIFVERPARWLSRNEPRFEVVEELLRQLRLYLGEEP